MATFDADDFVERYKDGEDKKTTRLVGLELEIEREDREEEGWLMDAADSVTGFAGYGSDGGDIEVVTDPVSEGFIKEGGGVIKNVVKLLNDNHCMSCFGGGTHINVAKLEGDYKYTYDNIIWLTIVFNEQIEKVFGRHSHWAKSPLEQYNWFGRCQQRRIKKNARLADRMFQIFVKEIDGVSKAMSDINNKHLMVTDKGNRYEFRGAKSSVNLDECLAWAEFCLNMTRIAATNKTLQNVKFENFLEGEYIEKYFNEVIQQNNTRKLTKEELKDYARRKQELTIIEEQDFVY